MDVASPPRQRTDRESSASRGAAGFPEQDLATKFFPVDGAQADPLRGRPPSAQGEGWHP